jgi:hypothetical protein
LPLVDPMLDVAGIRKNNCKTSLIIFNHRVSYVEDTVAEKHPEMQTITRAVAALVYCRTADVTA